MPAQRRPDAMFLPPSMIHGAEPTARATSVADTCRLTLCDRPGLQHVHSGRDAHTLMQFVRLDPEECRLYPCGHLHQGQERYEWFFAERTPDGAYTPVAPSGGAISTDQVLVGYLKEDPHPQTPEDSAEAVARLAEEYRASGGHAALIKRLTIEGGRTDVDDVI